MCVCVYVDMYQSICREGAGKERETEEKESENSIYGGAPPATLRKMAAGSNAYLAARRLLNIFPCEYV